MGKVRKLKVVSLVMVAFMTLNPKKGYANWGASEVSLLISSVTGGSLVVGGVALGGIYSAYKIYYHCSLRNEHVDPELGARQGGYYYNFFRSCLCGKKMTDEERERFEDSRKARGIFNEKGLEALGGNQMRAIDEQSNRWIQGGLQNLKSQSIESSASESLTNFGKSKDDFERLSPELQKKVYDQLQKKLKDLEEVLDNPETQKTSSHEPEDITELSEGRLQRSDVEDLSTQDLRKLLETREHALPQVPSSKKRQKDDRYLPSSKRFSKKDIQYEKAQSVTKSRSLSSLNELSKGY